MRHSSFHLPSRALLVQSQQWKHQSNVWKLFKVNNKDTRTTSMTSFWCLYRQLWKDFTYSSGVSIVDFEQVKAGWDINPFMHWSRGLESISLKIMFIFRKKSNLILLFWSENLSRFASFKCFAMPIHFSCPTSVSRIWCI